MASITIPLFYDLDLLLWTSAAGGIARQPNLVLGQSDSIAFAVQFVRSGVVIELTTPAWICGIKPINDVAGDYLCQTTTGVQTGSGASTVYTFTLLLDSTELRAWLLTVTAVSNYAAFSIRDTVNLIATLPAITCTILPDYTLEGTTPTDASGTLIVDSGQTFTVHKSFAMPTTDGFNNYVLKTNGAGVGSWAVDSAGTGTVTNVTVTTANGVSGSVATSTTTPAITLTLGAITPTTGAFSDETEATNSTTAPLKTAGGMAVAKSLYVGEGIQVLGTGNRSLITDELQIGGDLLVRYLTSYANETILDLSPIAGSVNNLAIEPSLTTLPVHIYAQGADANIGLHLQAKGTGFVNVQDGTTNTKRLRFDVSGNSSAVITTLASSSTTSQTITLPNATGATTLAGLQMTQSFTQVNTFSSSTASTSTTSGAVVITGGLGVGGNAYVGGVINIPATTSTAGQITQGGSVVFHTFRTDNLFLGAGAGNFGATLGANNIGIGKNSLLACTTGTSNTGIGRITLTALTTGSNNVAVGDDTGTAITDGEYNILVGRNAGKNITTGDNNSAIGGLALTTCSTGSSNVAIGYQSLGSTNAGSNTAVGHNSGYYSTSNNGTYIGQSAGIATATVGNLAGAQITSGANCTMLGQASSSTSATGNYRTAIGSDSRCQSDNAIKLGRDYSASNAGGAGNAGDITILAQIPTANLPAASASNKGAIVYNTNDNVLYFSNGSSWLAV